MRKMTGREYKEFLKSDWDSILGVSNAYMDGQEIRVDDGEEPEDTTTIKDTAKVVITYGCVLADQDLDMSLSKFVDKWRKIQTHSILLVQLHKDNLEEFYKALAGCKGKILD